jgi:hypothetical protein
LPLSFDLLLLQLLRKARQPYGSEPPKGPELEIHHRMGSSVRIAEVLLQRPHMLAGVQRLCFLGLDMFEKLVVFSLKPREFFF